MKVLETKYWWTSISVLFHFADNSMRIKLLSNLTHCILIDFSTVICWMSPFIILGVSGLFCHFCSIFDEKSC